MTVIQGRHRLYQTLYNAQQALATAKANLNGLQGTPSTANIQKAQATLDLAEAQLTRMPKAPGTWLRMARTRMPSRLHRPRCWLPKNWSILAQITAPFDGTITQANVIPGAVVSAGTQIFRIDNLSNLVVAVQVTEIDINGIQGRAACHDHL